MLLPSPHHELPSVVTTASPTWLYYIILEHNCWDISPMYLLHILPAHMMSFQCKNKTHLCTQFLSSKKKEQIFGICFHVCVCFQFYEGRALGRLDFYLELLHQWRSSHHLRYSMTVLSVHWTHAHQKADNFIECYSKCFHWIKCFFFFCYKTHKILWFLLLKLCFYQSFQFSRV